MTMRAYHQSWYLLHIVHGLLILTAFVHNASSSSDYGLIRLSKNGVTEEEGTRVKVDCHALVNEAPKSLEWISLRDHQQAATQIMSNDRKSVTLVFPSLHRYNAGTYTCLLITASGERDKAELTLHVRPRNGDVQTCRPTQFKCKFTKDCIFLKYRCDGKDDCGDGSDEECSGDPCANRFICNNTRCVDFTYRCDHVDNCGDNSDERACYEYRFKKDKVSSTTDPSAAAANDGDDDNNYSWVKSTIYTIIASTIGLVILISIGVILVFRAKMKRIRERRMVRAINAMQIYEEPRMPPLTGDGCVEEEPFLPRNVQRFHQGPSIIFNVNNGVQYMPRYRYFVENPPPYSEVQGSGGGGEGEDRPGRSGGNNGGGGDHVTNTPPPYSTLDRSGETEQEVQGTRNNAMNRDPIRTNQRAQRSRGPPAAASNGANNVPVASNTAGRYDDGNSGSSPSSVLHTAGTCEWSRRHSGSEYCPGCVHCVPSSSAPQVSNNNAGLGTELHRDEWPSRTANRFNHHLNLSQGQGPVVAVEQRQQRAATDRNESSTGNSQSAMLARSNLNGTGQEFRGVDINPHFLQNLLTSSSSSSSHHGSQRLTASVDSESCSNESHGSAASSSSSCGDDSVSSHTLLGMAGPSGTGRDSIHDTETLKTRDRDVPCVVPGGDVQRFMSQNPPVVNDNDKSLIGNGHCYSNTKLQPNLGAYDVNNSNNGNDNNSMTTSNVVSDISSSGLPNSISGDVGEENSLPLESESNEHRHLLESEADPNPRLQFNTENGMPSAETDSGAPTLCPSSQPSHHPGRSSDLRPSPVAALLPSPSPVDSSSGSQPSSAVTRKVANHDRSNQHKAVKQGHLSVHKGQIVLHTSDGLLAGQSIIPIVPAPLLSTASSSSSSQPGNGQTTAAAMPHLSGEIIVKDGNIMLQIPVGKSLMPSGHVGFPCMENPTPHQQPLPSPPSSSSSSSKSSQPPIEDDSRVNNCNQDIPSSLTANSTDNHPEISNNKPKIAEQPTQFESSPKRSSDFVPGGELLRFRDGQLVLEPPQPKTPSSQILSQLQGAECLSSSLSGVLEEEDGVPVGPVGNDKRHRPAAGNAASGHHHHRHNPSSSKACNSDVVLPRGGLN